jgi:hypothetical protein
MIPDAEHEARRRKWVPYIGWMIIASMVSEAVFSTFLPAAWQPLPMGIGIVAITVISIISRLIDPPARGAVGGRLRRSRSRRGVVAAYGADGDAAPAEAAASRPRLMTLAGWLMPRSAGRRWLAEADSLLAEIAPSRRARAIRSYLWSAPSLAAMLWAREALRRTRAGRRRPG